MRKYIFSISMLAAIAVLGVAAFGRPSVADQTQANPQRFEYKVVPAKELGVHVSGNGSVFDYDGMAEKLSAYGKDGWRYRDTVSAGDLSAVLLERKQ